MNTIKEEFTKLIGFMYGGREISNSQMKDMERIFYAGAMAVNIAVLKSGETDDAEKNIGELFDHIHNQCEILTKE